MKRALGRGNDQVRPIKITYDFCRFAAGSVLYEAGNTKVLCSVTLQENVPAFLKGKKTGWLSAEYAMLPTATQQRTEREVSSVKRNGRSVEISRLIGRCFRAIVDLNQIGARTILIDCDVLQADGSTRTACITAAYLALQKATQKWIDRSIVTPTFLKHEIAAVSVGFCSGHYLLDIDFSEDSSIDADFTFVMTRAGEIVEVQASSEKMPIAWHHVQAMQQMAQKGIDAIFTHVAHVDNSGLSLAEQKPVKKVFNQIRLKESNP